MKFAHASECCLLSEAGHAGTGRALGLLRFCLGHGTKVEKRPDLFSSRYLISGPGSSEKVSQCRRTAALVPRGPGLPGELAAGVCPARRPGLVGPRLLLGRQERALRGRGEGARCGQGSRPEGPEPESLPCVLVSSVGLCVYVRQRVSVSKCERECMCVTLCMCI